jgi:hypothetical protein
MKFVADPILDVRRMQYKREYDENFAKIRDSRDCPELIAKLQRNERRLQNRTVAFLRAHNFYFSRKRNYLMTKISEGIGAFEDQERTEDEL